MLDSSIFYLVEVATTKIVWKKLLWPIYFGIYAKSHWHFQITGKTLLMKPSTFIIKMIKREKNAIEIKSSVSEENFIFWFLIVKISQWTL